jgi:hypothetical protein
LYPTYKDQIKKALEGTDEDLYKLFYVIEDDVVSDMTELGKLITACENCGVPPGFTIKDVVEGNVEPYLALALYAKLWIDDDIAQLKQVHKKKEKKSKSNDKVVNFRTRNDGEINKET